MVSDPHDPKCKWPQGPPCRKFSTDGTLLGAEIAHTMAEQPVHGRRDVGHERHLTRAELDRVRRAARHRDDARRDRHVDAAVGRVRSYDELRSNVSHDRVLRAHAERSRGVVHDVEIG